MVLTREPRKEGLIGDIVQNVLQGKQKVPSAALQYLFSTDRVLHHEDVILPALKKGKIVISDRCFWSAVVYGILDRTAGYYDTHISDILLISQSILSMYHQFTVPDYTFYLQISPETAMQRIGMKNEVKEIYEEEDQLKKVITGYNWLVDKFSNEITVVDGEGDVEKVTGGILAKLPK